jgi:hypothetical protein
MEPFRVDEEYVVSQRFVRGETLAAWKARIAEIDERYAGVWRYLSSDGRVQRVTPKVQNLIRDALHDAARLVAETIPAIRTRVYGSGEAAERDATLRRAIVATYDDANRMEDRTPRFVFDLAGTGVAIDVVLPGRIYPSFWRVNPRLAYPGVVDGQVLDLIVVSEMKARHAARLWPDLGLATGPHDPDTVEVADYYSAEVIAKVVYPVKGGAQAGRARTASTMRNPLGRPPVVFTALDTLDEHYRGIIDQVAPVLETENTIVELILANASQMVAAPILDPGLENAHEYGPGAILRGTPEAVLAVRRLEPSNVSPQLFALAGLLSASAHAMASSPEAREGEIRQSIASGSFVHSVLGKLQSVILELTRKRAQHRREVAELALLVDQAFLDFEKPLAYPVGRRYTYRPGRDIGGRSGVEYVYGATAGLDKANQSALIERHIAAGLISRRAARRELHYLSDPEEMEREILEEIALETLLQKTLPAADPASHVPFWQALRAGEPIEVAISHLTFTQGQGVPGEVGRPPEPRSVEEEVMAQAAGGMPAYGAPMAPPELDELVVAR